MTLAFLSLGSSSLTGNAGVEQAISFKKQLRSVHPFPDGAYVRICPNPETRHCEARAIYERTIPGAREWAEKAVELAPDIWASLSERRKERGAV